MNLVVIDPTVFVAGVLWRHEPHLCLKAWLRGMITPVMKAHKQSGMQFHFARTARRFSMK
jgi:hypothetical protein